MKVIATRTDDAWGLIEEEEFTGEESLKQIFLEFGWVKPYDITKPLPPKGINDYEPGKVYPPNRYVIELGKLRKSNCNTSPVWVESEWDIKINGL